MENEAGKMSAGANASEGNAERVEDGIAETLSVPLRIGTRASLLALWQANWCADSLQRNGIPVEIVKITASGDRPETFAQPIAGGSAQGIFTKEIQDALLAGEVDLAVHSLKDLPTEMVPGLQLTAVPPRAETQDVLVVGRSAKTLRKFLNSEAAGSASTAGTEGTETPGTETPGTETSDAAGTDRFSGIDETGGSAEMLNVSSLADLPDGAILGTSSLRRRAQLLAFAARHGKKWEVRSVRGNLITRFRKLDDGEYDVLILARAGVERLEMEKRINAVLSIDEMFPAVSQGALGIETRAEDAKTNELVRSFLNDETVFQCVKAERALLKALEGGCAAPIGGFCTYSDETGQFTLRGRVIALDGRTFFDETLSGPEAEDLGKTLAKHLVELGAGELIREARAAAGV